MGSGSGEEIYAGTRGALPMTKPDDNFSIGRSVGARAPNYDIKDPSSGRKYRFAEGTTISQVEVFAGKGVRSKLRPKVVEGLVRDYGGKARNWQHAKGIGTIDMGDGYQTAEVHWFQEPSAGKHGFKIKRWL